MNMHRFTTASFFSVLLCGCAAKYAIQEGEPSAKVRFRTEAEAWINVSTFANQRCDPNPLGEKLGAVGHGDHFSMISAQPNSLEMLGSEAPTTKRIERIVRAEKTFFFAFEHAYISSPRVGCNKTASFLPAAGAQYEAEFLLFGSSCNVNLSRIEKTSSGELRRSVEPTLKVYPTACTVQKLFNNPWD